MLVKNFQFQFPVILSSGIVRFSYDGCSCHGNRALLSLCFCTRDPGHCVCIRKDTNLTFDPVYMTCYSFATNSEVWFKIVNLKPFRYACLDL
ncbi:hypothetical protein VNO78_11745 [Psophocarpus tetragonolobus]|uniref:Uncharacterized protein n=1 Tax=Psophocarpus tetragonolobus TaxID=3891 RepID=A0AAN9SPU9_PSOTE